MISCFNALISCVGSNGSCTIFSTSTINKSPAGGSLGFSLSIASKSTTILYLRRRFSLRRNGCGRVEASPTGFSLSGVSNSMLTSGKLWIHKWITSQDYRFVWFRLPLVFVRFTSGSICLVIFIRRWAVATSLSDVPRSCTSWICANVPTL